MKNISITNDTKRQIHQVNINGEILELTLPTFLINDIKALETGIKNSSSVLDCLYDEVQGSINAAFYDNSITEEEADYLRNKYL